MVGRGDAGDLTFMGDLGNLRGHWSAPVPKPLTMRTLVDAWMAHANSACSEGTSNVSSSWASEVVDELTCHPDLMFDFFQRVLTENPAQKICAFLAAGPVEDFLVRNGESVIDRVEIFARQNPGFRHLLGGVWQNAISDDVWARVLRVAPDRW